MEIAIQIGLAIQQHPVWSTVYVLAVMGWVYACYRYKDALYGGAIVVVSLLGFIFALGALRYYYP